MIDVEITLNARNKAKKYQVQKKLDKQVEFLKDNPRHGSLNYKPMEALKDLGIWRFRLDKHYWALTRKNPNKLDSIEVYDVIIHPK